MRFGIELPTCTSGMMHPVPFATVHQVVDLAIEAEQLGYHEAAGNDHLSTMDYIRKAWNEPPDFFEPLVVLAHVAAKTSVLRLATGIMVMTLRDPVLLAKQVATLDRFSGGRLILGVGIGWQREESEACGFPFTDRGRRTDEFIGAMRALWTEREASFQGRWVSFDRLYCHPRPARPGGPPILIGGHSPAAARRAGRLGDGMFALVADPAGAASIRTLMDAAARDAGRDPSALELTVGRPPDVRAVRPSEVLDEVRAYRDAGADRLILFRLFDSDPDPLIAELESFARTVIDRM